MLPSPKVNLKQALIENNEEANPPLFKSQSGFFGVTKTGFTGINKIPQVKIEKEVREIALLPTACNKLKLFFANIYETLLIILCLWLSVYQEDASTIPFQIIIQVVLFYSMKEMGKYVKIQRNIILGSIISLVALSAFKFVVLDRNKALAGFNYTTEQNFYKLLGLKFFFDSNGVAIQADLASSFSFEIVALVLTLLLLIFYSGQIKRQETKQPFQLINHSLWLNQYNVLYVMFFVILTFDAYFSQTVIQFTVLFFLNLSLFLWAFNSPKTNSVIRFMVTWSQRLYVLQLICYALFETPLIDVVRQSPGFTKLLFIIGLAYDQDNQFTVNIHFLCFQATVHLFLMCFTLGFGELYKSTYSNYFYFEQNKDQYEKAAQYKLLMEQQQEEDQTDKKFKWGDKKAFDPKKFVETYLPYVCIWMARFFSLAIAYYYHGIPSFLVLTWILFSFLIRLTTFVEFTTKIYLPIISVFFFYGYICNIPGLFFRGTTEFVPEVFYFTRIYQAPPFEIAFQSLNIVFLITLVHCREMLKIQQDEFRQAIFKKLSDKESIFLWQLSFYFLKRIHIFILSPIVIFGMQELNLYYIGIMVLFVIYASSLTAYRESGIKLSIYAAFFIWIGYFWSLASVYFATDSFVSKIFMMLTFSKYSDVAQKDSSLLNKYMQYKIPLMMWLILMLTVLMSTINKFFKIEGDKAWKSFEDDKKEITYKSTADYYEAKCDFVLRRKFPGMAKFLVRITMIFSEMMILIILIVQGAIVASQTPNVIFWGFLVFSFTLQTAVVSITSNDSAHLQKCSTNARVLQVYSAITTFLQIIYYFITHPSFLAQYGFDTILQKLLGGINDYMQIIGFFDMQKNESELKKIFLSQVIFYITATILRDYFNAQIKLQEGLDQLEQQKKEHQHSHQYTHPEDEDKKGAYLRHQSTVHGEVVDNVGEEERIRYEYDRIRFSVPYMVYQRIGSWPFLDSVTQNWHLVTALVTIILCTNWQISLFMSFYLICTVFLCIKAAKALYSNGQNRRAEDREITVTKAHSLNKEYMQQANEILLNVRTNQWNWQYWILVFSIIIAYPTPLLIDLRADQLKQYTDQINTSIFWLFWSGIYIPKAEGAANANIPPYVMLILLILEKCSQRWQKNRYGCSIEKIREFKKLEEQLKVLDDKKNVREYPYKIYDKKNQPKLPIDKVITERDFVTFAEAKQECARIQLKYHFQTTEHKEKHLRQVIETAIKRKYIIQFRSAMKIFMEQLSLLLLLLSCANKSNFISIIYLGLLLTFLLIKNKTSGMLIMSYFFGIVLALEYISTLLNLTSVTSPMTFPPIYSPFPEIQNGVATSPFFIPVFLNMPMLRDNLKWAVFFGFDMERSQVNDIWFDFVNLMVLTLYFFNFGNPINAQGLKVSFSKTCEIEENLQKYSRIQMKKKVGEIKGENVDDLHWGRKRADSFDSEEVAELDNSQEHYLGSTFYLNDLKSRIFIYNFVKKMKFVFYIGAQIMTLLIIFTIAILCRSLMSLGYMIALVPLVWSITDFFNLEKLHQEGKRWNHPHIISGPLMIFSFVDIALQIMFQIPFVQGTNLGVERLFGFDKIYTINGDLTFEQLLAGSELTKINAVNFSYLVLKSINLFHIFLQSRIYESQGFWKFVRIDLRNLMVMANGYKKTAMAYRLNNGKLQQVVTNQQNKKKMYQGVSELKMKLQVWQNMISSGTFGTKKNTSGNQPLLPVEEEKEEQDFTRKDDQERQSESRLTGEPEARKSIQFKKKTAAQFLNQGLNLNKVKEHLENDKDYFEKKKILKSLKPKLGRCGGIYLWLKKQHSNQILFITQMDECQHVKKELEKGKSQILCDLEKIMMRDINIQYRIYQKKRLDEKKAQRRISKYVFQPEEKKSKDVYELSQMKKTVEFLSGTHIIQAVFGAFFQAMFSKSSTFAYCFMIFSMIHNAGFISILYPLGVFGYALMEEGRPGKWFWKMMINYTLAILFIKFIIQLDMWQSQQGLIDSVLNINNWILSGLKGTSSIGELLWLILPEVLVLGFILSQIYYENLIGLYERKEIQIEDISQARERYLNAMSQTEMSLQGKTFRPPKKQLADEDEELDGETFDQRIAQIKQDLKENKIIAGIQDEKSYTYENFIENKSNQINIELFKNKETVTITRRYSFVDDNSDRYATVKKIKIERAKGVDKGMVKKYFGKKSYFQRLFPLIKEQKPGIDFYASITFTQFVICFYLIKYYTQMDAYGTQNLENTSQFSFNMVVMLFIQIFIMILERYIARTNTRVIVKKSGQKKATEIEMADKELATMKMTDSNRSMSTINIQKQTTGDTIMASNFAVEKLEIDLKHTKMTAQQVIKYVSLLILILLYHIVIFWVFPLVSNYAIYGEPDCDLDSPNYKANGCYNFHTNPYLIIFYLIFCRYFCLSALQIRYGLPDFRRGSSLTSSYTLWTCLGYRIFYVLPFLLELKTILDWCFTRTSLDIYQWLELAQIYSEMYFYRCANAGYFLRPLGKQIEKFEKYLCGCFCIGVILFFLAGPFLFFSNLSSIAKENLVTGAQIDFGMGIFDGNTNNSYDFRMFTSQNPLNLDQMSQTQYVRGGYGKNPTTKFFEPNMIQVIRMQNSSDTDWTISDDNKQTFIELLANASSNDTQISVQLKFYYKFERPLPELAKVASGSQFNPLDPTDPNDLQTINALSAIAKQDCSASPNMTYNIDIFNLIPNVQLHFIYFLQMIRLSESTEIQPLISKEFNTFINFTLTYSCQGYWAINVNSTEQEGEQTGIIFQVFSDMVSGGFFGATSIMGFYIAVAYLVGGALRKMVVYNTDRIFVCDIPNSEVIINLCDCIYMQRLEGNLKKEEQLYFVLMECMRSPEMLKAMTGHSIQERPKE